MPVHPSGPDSWLLRPRGFFGADVNGGSERLAWLLEVSRDFAATPDLDAILERVTRRIGDGLSGGCSVRLVDPTGSRLVPVTSYHPDPDRQAALDRLLDRDIGIDEGLSGKVITSGLPGIVRIYSPDAAEIPQDPVLADALHEYGRPSAAIASLRVNGRTLGVITVLRDEQHEPLNQDDLDVLVALADRAAQAIRNAQLMGEQARRDSALALFARSALTLRDSAAVRQVAVDLLVGALAARFALLMEADAHGVLTVSVVAGPPDGAGLPQGTLVDAVIPVDVYRCGRPMVCHDMRHDEAKGMVALGRALGADSGLAVQLPGRTKPLGVLSVVAVGTGRFADDDLSFVTAFAGLLSAALQRLEAQRSVEVVAEERRLLLNRLVSAQEDERARIADGVHHDQVQAVAAAELRLEMLLHKAGGLDAAVADDAALAREAVRGSADRLRALLFDLEPLAEAGLDEALDEAAAHLLEPIGATWTVVADAPASLTASQRTLGYRIAKEALANAARHAGATHVSVRIDIAEGGVWVLVEDNGVGMAHIPGRSPTGHRGLNSMRDWAEVAGGRLEITSTPGDGTSVRLWLPTSR